METFLCLLPMAISLGIYNFLCVYLINIFCTFATRPTVTKLLLYCIYFKHYPLKIEFIYAVQVPQIFIREVNFKTFKWEKFGQENLLKNWPHSRYRACANFSTRFLFRLSFQHWPNFSHSQFSSFRQGIFIIHSWFYAMVFDRLFERALARLFEFKSTFLDERMTWHTGLPPASPL